MTAHGRPVAAIHYRVLRRDHFREKDFHEREMRMLPKEGLITDVQ